jgi:phosphoribosyl-ATP pyrophosphohydrolase
MCFCVLGVHDRCSSIVQRITARVKGMPVTDLNNVLSRLMGVIEDRKANPPEKSYTTKLFNGGTAKIGEKILEEAEEVMEAADEAGEEGRAHLIYEAADLLFHLMVMLGFKDIHIHEVEAELSRRFGISGIDEKAARQ